MYGAILGDLAGSRVEFNGNTDPQISIWTEPEPFTDDTVLTVAVAKALLDGADFGEELRLHCLRYPDRGYGPNFLHWAETGELIVNSCGNGAPMRISPVAYVAHTESEVMKLSEAATKPSHPHPDAIDAATAVALMTFRALRGEPKHSLFARLGPTWSRLEPVSALRRQARWEALAIPTVRQALTCVYEANSFEEAIRNAISIGGDADTIAAIAGSIAEPLFGISAEQREYARKALSPDLLGTIDAFEARFVQVIRLVRK